MARNKLVDAENHIFAALERLNDETLTDAQLEFEIKRGATIAKLGQAIVKSNAIKLNAMRMVAQGSLNSDDVNETLRLNITNNQKLD